MRSVMGAIAGPLVLLLGLALTLTAAELKPPTVNIYTQTPVEFGQENSLICHCSNFHPPRITMHLKKDGKVLENCNESDLSFAQDWTYYVTKHIKFTPEKDAVYECVVQHNEGKPQTYRLEIF